MLVARGRPTFLEETAGEYLFSVLYGVAETLEISRIWLLLEAWRGAIVWLTIYAVSWVVTLCLETLLFLLYRKTTVMSAKTLYKSCSCSLSLSCGVSVLLE